MSFEMMYLAIKAELERRDRELAEQRDAWGIRKSTPEEIVAQELDRISGAR